MIKKKAFQLAKALRSGKYKQFKRRLRSGVHEFCCLGVACKLEKVKWSKDYKVICACNGVEYMVEVVLPTNVQKSFGFAYEDGGRSDGKDIIIDGQEYAHLANANDDGVTFDKIADYIEENWEYL